MRVRKKEEAYRQMAVFSVLFSPQESMPSSVCDDGNPFIDPRREKKPPSDVIRGLRSHRIPRRKKRP